MSGRCPCPTPIQEIGGKYGVKKPIDLGRLHQLWRGPLGRVAFLFRASHLGGIFV